jgi:hypothetical protein
MKATHIQRIGLGMITLLFGMTLFAGQGMAMDPKKSKVVGHWTQERMNQAIPRDLVIDPRGLGYLRRPDGSFQPHGHQIAAEQGASRRQPQGKPSGNTDSTPPEISNMDPASDNTIGTSHTFAATVIDDGSGVKSVTFTIRYPDGTTTQSFAASKGANDVWTANLQGFSEGNWSWQVTAKDKAGRGGNTATSDWVTFNVGSGGGDSGSGSGSGTGDTITNSQWSFGGAVQTAMGRIYFEMPSKSNWKGPWQGYVCSGTVVTDTEGTGGSVILTAAHCVYDDTNKAFARNVLFIPNQAETSGSGTDLNCNNDPLGCWVPSFGVVDTEWTTRVFPNNIEWDYAYYVVNDSGAHTGNGASVILDSASAAGSLPIQFSPVPSYYDETVARGSEDFTHALGYSYDQDPNFMYCAEDMTTEGAVNWWLPSCGLSGGSSGGAWVQPMDESTGTGQVVSVNSWGYTTSPGMAGPMLDSTASCLFVKAENFKFKDVSSVDGKAGFSVDGTSCY